MTKALPLAVLNESIKAAITLKDEICLQHISEWDMKPGYTCVAKFHDVDELMIATCVTADLDDGDAVVMTFSQRQGKRYFGPGVHLYLLRKGNLKE